jgi:hypothetical protein
MVRAIQRRRLRYRYRRSREIPCREVCRQVGHQTEEAQEAEVEEDHLDRRVRHHHHRVNRQGLQQLEAMVLVRTCTEWIRNYSNDQ